MRTLIVTIFFAASVHAQTVVSGVLLDPSDRPVPGAMIRLSKRSVRTSAEGEFRFENVSPGRHRLVTRVVGFELVDKTVRMNRRPVRITLRLSLATVRERLTIDADGPGLGPAPDSNRNVISVDRPLLDTLPVLDLNYINALARFLDPGASSAAGGEGTGVSLIVDGMEARNIGVTASAIQEIRINQNPYTAEYPRWSRRRIEVITKSGSEAFHGAANFSFRDSALDSRNAFAQTKADEQRRVFEGSLVGPLVDGSTSSFLLSGAQDEDDAQAAVYARGLAGAIRQNVATPRRDTRLALRAAHAFTDDNSHAGSLQLNYQDTFLYRQGAGGLTLPEASTDSRFREDELVANYRWTLSPTTLMQLRGLVGRYAAPLRSVSHGPRVIVSDAFIGGGAQQDLNRTEFHTSIAWIMSHARGRHAWKYGINVPDWSRRGLSDRSYQQGAFSYASLDDLRLARPFAATYQAGNPRFVFVEKNIGGFVQDDWQVRPNFSLSMGVRYDWQNVIGSASNIAPRAAIAWSPGHRRTWVVRLGAGTFFERSGPNPIAEGRRFLPGFLNRYLLTGPAAPTTHLSGLPTAVTYLEEGIDLGRIYQFSAGVERQLTKRTTLVAGYTGWRAPAQLRSRDANAPRPPFFLVRPNPKHTTIRIIESSGRAVSDSMELTLRGELFSKFQGTAQYVFGKASNNATNYNFFPASSYAQWGEWARSDSDRRHQFNLLATARLHPWANFGVSAAALSAIPFNITTGRDDNRDGFALDRPDGVARNTGSGPATVGLDLRWFHDFQRRKEGPSLSISVDSFNLFNRMNAPSYVGAQSSPFFGTAVSSQPPRRTQLGVRYQF